MEIKNILRSKNNDQKIKWFNMTILGYDIGIGGGSGRRYGGYMWNSNEDKKR